MLFIPSRKLTQKHIAHSDVIYDLDWSQDDSNLLTASADCSVKLWSIKPWILLSSFVHPSYVYSAKFQPSLNDVLVTACYDHVIRIWISNKSVQMLQELEGHSSAVNTLCWHLKGLKIFSADNSGEIKVWKMLQNPKDASKNFDCCVLEKDLNFLDLKGTSIDKIALDSCRDILFLFCGDGNIRLLDVATESILFYYTSISKPQNIIKGCCSPCGNLLFVCNNDGKISVWNSISSNTAVTLPNTLHPCQLTSIDYHPFEHMLAVSASEESGCICLYTFDKLVPLLEANEFRSMENNSNANTSNMNVPIKTIPKSNSEDVNETYSDSSKFTKGYMYDDESIDEGFTKLSLGKCNVDKDLSDSEASVLKKSKGHLMERKKTESFTAIITQSGQFDVIAVADSCTESNNHESGSQSSKSIQPDTPKKHSKRSLRRKRLREGKTYK